MYVMNLIHGNQESKFDGKSKAMNNLTRARNNDQITCYQVSRLAHLTQKDAIQEKLKNKTKLRSRVIFMWNSNFQKTRDSGDKT